MAGEYCGNGCGFCGRCDVECQYCGEYGCGGTCADRYDELSAALDAQRALDFAPDALASWSTADIADHAAYCDGMDDDPDDLTELYYGQHVTGPDVAQDVIVDTFDRDAIVTVTRMSGQRVTLSNVTAIETGHTYVALTIRDNGTATFARADVCDIYAERP